MLAELKRELAGADLLVMTAAVADFRPARIADDKIRREETSRLTLELEQVPDLLAALGNEKEGQRVFSVGFAAQGSDLAPTGLEKRKKKRLQPLAPNHISPQPIAFAST